MAPEVRWKQQTSAKNPKKNFCRLINEWIEIKNINRAQLARDSGLSRTTIWRILTDNNGKGHPYQPTEDVVWQLSLGLRLTEDEHNSLMQASGILERRKILAEALNHHHSVVWANAALGENDLALLGSD